MKTTFINKTSNLRENFMDYRGMSNVFHLELSDQRKILNTPFFINNPFLTITPKII